jgi:hypothetical protein
MLGRRAALLVSLSVLAAACSQPGPTRGPGATLAVRTPDLPGATGAPPVGPGQASGRAEPGVVKGRVTTALGNPVAGADIEILGSAGGGGRHDDRIETGADGTFRVEVPDGLYEVTGTAMLDWEGVPFRLPLAPADGSCEQELSADGIVADQVVQLRGLRFCLELSDPDDDAAYAGGAIHLYPDFVSTTPPPDATVEIVLTPDGPLADGSAGETLTMTRTVAALSNYAGDIDETATLYDIPLGRYTVTARLLDGGSESPLSVEPETAAGPAAEATITFRPAELHPYGLLDQPLYLSDAGLG